MSTSLSSVAPWGWRAAALLVALCLTPWLPCPEAARADGTAAAADASAAAARVAELGGRAARSDDGTVTSIVITDGGDLATDDMRLFGSLPRLTALQLLNCRLLDDSFIEALGTAPSLRSLSVTNSALTDAGVAAIAAAYPDLEELDLSSNTNLTGNAMRSIASLEKLRRLTLIQNRFNDLHTRRLRGLDSLEVLDLRGNMQTGDMTLGTVGGLPKLRAFKHRSTIVTDDGVERLAGSTTLAALLMQDFAVSDAAGGHLAGCDSLRSLEIFRCQGFGTAGVLALAGLPLERLTLRDLPEVGDNALAVLAELPRLERLSLHELTSVGDAGLAQLAAAENLRTLDIWALPTVTDATAKVIAALPALEELSIRETAMTPAALETLLTNERLASLIFKNGDIPADVREQVAARTWKKLDLGN
jgi:hypothetical protein